MVHDTSASSPHEEATMTDGKHSTIAFVVLVMLSAMLGFQVRPVLANELFPIGLYQAGVQPTWFRYVANGQPCADNDTDCSANQWFNFEEVRGDTGTAQVYGYTS